MAPFVIPVRIDHAVGRRIAEQHPALALKPRDGLAVGDVIALAVRDRHADHLAGVVARVKAVSDRSTRRYKRYTVAADEAKLRVAHQQARQQSGLAGDLKAVADRKHQPALLREGPPPHP